MDHKKKHLAQSRRGIPASFYQNKEPGRLFYLAAELPRWSSPCAPSRVFWKMAFQAVSADKYPACRFPPEMIRGRRSILRKCVTGHGANIFCHVERSRDMSYSFRIRGMMGVVRNLTKRSPVFVTPPKVVIPTRSPSGGVPARRILRFGKITGARRRVDKISAAFKRSPLLQSANL